MLECSSEFNSRNVVIMASSGNLYFLLQRGRGLTTLSANVVFLFVWITFFTAKTTGHTCSLPATWEGKWFVNEFANSFPIVVNPANNSISRDEENLGECIWSDNDRFIFFNKYENCSRCILISQKHKNVLQTREDICEPENEWDKDNPESLCYNLQSSDAHFWFRFDYKPIGCPFKGMSFDFSYRKSGGQKCESPISHSKSCIDSTYLELQYEACHDLKNSVGKSERLTCVGDWEDSGYRYFVAESHSLTTRSHRSLQDRFRCFIVKEVTERDPVPSKPDIIVGYEIGTSESASCGGLHNPQDAETTLYFRKNNSEVKKPCSFPSWLADHKWLNMERTVEFQLHSQLKNRRINVDLTKHSHIAPDDSTQQQQHNFRRQSSFFPMTHSSLECAQIMNISNENDAHFAVVGKYHVECEIDLICLHFVKRSDYIFQIYYLERGEMSMSALQKRCFNMTLSDLKNGATMISTHGTEKACPNPGNYSVEIRDVGSLEGQLKGLVGCTDSRHIEFEMISSENTVMRSSSLICTDGWEDTDAGVNYTVLATTKFPPTPLQCMISSTTSLKESVGPEPNQNRAIITSQDCVHFVKKHIPVHFGDSDNGGESLEDIRYSVNGSTTLSKQGSCSEPKSFVATNQISDGFETGKHVENTASGIPPVTGLAIFMMPSLIIVILCNL